MRRTVHVVFFALLVYLIGDRAMLHAQGRDASPLPDTEAIPVQPS